MNGTRQTKRTSQGRSPSNQYYCRTYGNKAQDPTALKNSIELVSDEWANGVPSSCCVNGSMTKRQANGPVITQKKGIDTERKQGSLECTDKPESCSSYLKVLDIVGHGSRCPGRHQQIVGSSVCRSGMDQRILRPGNTAGVGDGRMQTRRRR